MREILESKYNAILTKYGFKTKNQEHQLGNIMQQVIRQFIGTHKNTAIYGYDAKSRELMANFIFDLKSVKFIVDNDADNLGQSGYTLITEDKIGNYDIDSIMIFKAETGGSITRRLKENYPAIDCIDINTEMARHNFNLEHNVYRPSPYPYYGTINAIQRKINSSQQINLQDYVFLISQYVGKKDFWSAIIKTKKLYQLAPQPSIKNLLDDLQELYDLTIEAASKIAENNVLMLCLDGLGWNLPSLRMPKLSTVMYQRAYRYSNAYSYSSSTFESLIPVYSENTDLRTQYYKKDEVEGKNCRFIQEAKKQGRNIYFYAMAFKYIDDDAIIRRCTGFHPTTELLWEFLLDAVDETNGLFYVHSLYETHFSYVNPYTEDKLELDAMSIIFDFLESRGGKLRADYDLQHKESLRYIDDIWGPIVDKLHCRTLIYSDHGFNKNYPQTAQLKDFATIDLATVAENNIRIPMIIIAPEMGVGENSSLISLMELNNIVIDLLNHRKFDYVPKPFVKIGRSEIYNPEIRFLLNSVDKGRELLAFEGFIFNNGYKLIIYSNGETELYNINDDKKLKDSLLSQVKDKITVL